MHKFLKTTILLFTLLCGNTVFSQTDDFEHLFDGQTLDGWYGNNPHITAKRPIEERAAAIAEQQADFQEHWTVKDQCMVNSGFGPYATTKKEYGDIELLVDYKTVAKADSGIYVRGTPQVQIWDTTEAGGKWNRGAQFGSGGLFNNSPHAPGQLPLRHADNPFGEWNRVRILQVGSRTWVELNHQLVVDGAVMENFWNRDMPLPSSGPIQLQTHGGEIRWKNLLVRNIHGDEAISRLRGDDNKHGFTSIFNGEDLSGWSGAVDDYEVKDRSIVCKPGKGGVLFTEDQYENFIVRLEFQVPPGGNNGLAIRYPGTGRAAYDGMCELQVLDDDASQYAKLDPRQYHGSVYGIAPAHRGYLRPAGEWNYQEVTVDGSRIKVELNGTIIVDADVSHIREYKDGLAHPGKRLTQGHFGFAGHNDPVKFRNVAIKKLPNSRRDGPKEDVTSGMVFQASFDDVTDANLSTGDGFLLPTKSTKRESIAKDDDAFAAIEIAKGEGKIGDALRFKHKSDTVLFYEGVEANYQRENWSGSVSLWLKLDPDTDLEPGFCDPIQITERSWNDAAFFVDFDKELPRSFRLGAFPDLKTWNPDGIDFDDMPEEQRPMVTVTKPPFSSEEWTHVCFTWQNVNAADESDATATLYLNGKLQGSMKRPLKFTWRPDKAGIMIGLNYVGLMDQLNIYNRALTAGQVQYLHENPAKAY